MMLSAANGRLNFPEVLKAMPPSLPTHLLFFFSSYVPC